MGIEKPHSIDDEEIPLTIECIHFVKLDNKHHL
jgi:hypothetical protein